MRTWLLLAAILCATTGFGQEEEFNISIADKTEETGLLRKNEWQVEAGFVYNHFKNSAAAEIGQLFVRHAVSDKIEFRLLVEDGRERDKYISETVQATYPMAAGMKFKVLEHHPVLPDMTLVGYLNLPFTAHNKFQSIHWSPMIFMAFQHQFGEKWSLTYNTGGQQEAFGTSWSGIFNGSVHYKFTDDLEVFTEYFAQYEPGENPQHNLGGGATYSVSKIFAVYLTAASSVNNENPNNFYAAGLAMKIK